MKEEEPPSKKIKGEKPSEEKALNVQEEEEEEEKEEEQQEQEVEDKAEPCESIAEVNNVHTDEQNTDTSENQTMELKPPVSF